jgi:cytochrome b pre-mRNA-processing protein 3
MFDLFGKNKFKETTQGIYTSIVEQSRQPGFYLNCGVPDTPDGRFDMIMVHTFLVIRLLKGKPGEAADQAQAVFDLMFGDMDQNLREMGTGDTGIGKKIKAMAESFYGRIKVYEDGLADEVSLEDSLDRNLYRKSTPLPAEIKAFAAYMRREARQLEEGGVDKLLAGELTFGPVPAVSVEESEDNNDR